MNNGWKVIYYENIKGYSEVLGFINSLNDNEQAKVLSWITILGERGPNLPRPYSDLLEDGIHELRLKLTGKQVRVLYFFCYKEFIVLTSSFAKKTDKIPIKELLKAKNIREDFLQRYNKIKLQEVYDENS
ncbi:MAG: type II toxin-antitoxin system RelE/ParE family toxin [Deltaproteobacteria bacterium]